MSDVTRQPFSTGPGFWVCKECAAGITEGVMEHAPRCKWIAVLLSDAYHEGYRDGRAAEYEHLMDRLGNDHYVVITEDRWTVEHSAECRLGGNMAGCDFHVAIRDWMADVTDTNGQPLIHEQGRWRIARIDDDGWPGLERAQ
jgi:hypothetical protein